MSDKSENLLEGFELGGNVPFNFDFQVVNKSNPVDDKEIIEDKDKDEVEKDQEQENDNIDKKKDQINNDSSNKDESKQIKDEDDFLETPPSDRKKERETETETGKDNEKDSGTAPSELVQSFAEYLKESGVLDWDDEEEIDFSSPKALNSLIENSIQKEIEGYKNSISPEAKDFLDYLEAGGDPSKYYSLLSQPVDYDTVNLDDEKHQKMVIQEYLKKQGWKDDEIEDELLDIEDSGRLERMSKRYLNRLKEEHQTLKQKEIEQQKQLDQQRKQEYERYLNTLEDYIEKSEDIAGLPINKKDKSKFMDYITVPDKDGYTQYQKDIKKDLMKNSTALAYIMYKGFDFSDLEKKVKSKATSDFERKLGNMKTGASSKNNSQRNSDKDELPNKLKKLSWENIFASR